MRVLALGVALALHLTTSGCGQRERTLENAQQKLEAGQIEEALALLRDGLADSPDDGPLNLAYGRALVVNGQPSLAVWSLAKAGRDPVLANAASLLLARAQIAMESNEDAVATLQALLDREPDHLEALQLMVEARLEARQAEQALEHVEHALDLVPDDLGLRMSRMRVFLHLDRQEEAAEVLAEIRERIPSLEKLGPEEREFLAGRYCVIEAMFTHESGDSEKARPLFEKCLEAHPGHAQVISSASDFFDAIGEPDRATEVHRKALVDDPENFARRVSLSLRLTRSGRPAEAEALLKESTESHPSAWIALVDHYVDVEDEQNALEALDHAIAGVGEDVPEDWKVVRADLLIQTGRLDEAERAIGDLREEVYATTTRGRLELARGNPAKALELLERGIRLWPDGTMARYLAAQAAEQLGDFERAETEYREAYRSDQAYTDAGLQLAQLLASRGLPADALTLSLAYLQNKPDDALGYEQAIGYAVAARDGKMARALLAQYQRIPKLSVQAAIFAARQLLRTNQIEDAIELADGLRFDPLRRDHFELLKVRCDALVAGGRASEALTVVRRIRQQAPDRLELAELEARLLEVSGATDEARSIYSTVLEREPERTTAMRALAALSSRSGDPSRAIEMWERAAKADPADADSLVGVALQKQHGPEREQLLREALRRAPRNGLAAAELAAELVRDGEAAPAEVSALVERGRRFGAAERADEVAARIAPSTQP